MMNTAYAYKVFGICNYGKGIVANVICYEPTVLVETTVKGDIKIAGSLTAKKIKANAVTVAGSVDLEDSQIGGLVDVTGTFISKGVDFKKGLNITSSSIELINTIVRGSIIITSENAKPYLKLSCQTTVTGSVLFQGKAGVIEVSEDSIVQAKVINGSMEFVKVKCDKKSSL
jgi:hypothetical protein